MQIAAVIWGSEGIGEQVKASPFSYAWLCSNIHEVLSTAKTRLAEANRMMFVEYVFVERQRKYWSRVDHDFVDIQNFNDRFIREYGTTRDYTAHKHFHLHRAQYENSVVVDCTYWPGQPEFVVFKGAKCINQWRQADVVFDTGDVRPWLNLVARLIPDESEREHFLNLMAWIVQHPGIKPGHHLLLGGGHGIGKDSLLEPIQYAIGGGLPTEGTEIPANRMNVRHIKTEDLEGRFSYFLKNQLVAIQELRGVYTGERKKLQNRMKNFLAAPPAFLTVEEKFAHPYDIPNVAVWMATSNYTDALPLEPGERRWFAIWSYAAQFNPAESTAIWNWFGNGGVQNVAGYLKRRDVKKFAAHSAAPKTSWYENLVESGMTDTEASFKKLIGDRSGPFAAELVSPQDAADIINSNITNKNGGGHGECSSMPRVVNPGQVSTALRSAGWYCLGRVEKKIVEPQRVRRLRGTLFVAPDVTEKYTAIQRSKGGGGKLAELYFDHLDKTR